MNIKAVLLTVLLLGASFSVQAQEAPRKSTNTIPSPKREFRGVWVATVANIDWPSKPGLSTNEQKAELLALLDQAVKLKLNAVIFQVRPASDALYPSPYEPWSEFLTGQMGKPPEPNYDPLAFAVEEAHKRGLELHAWFNPFRASHPQAKSEISPNHISKTQPELVKQYGNYLWLDPGEKAARDYSTKVIMDVVRRYDIDGVHLDDYFYPYPQTDEKNQIVEFPDEASWQKYLQSGGEKSRDDWRRENINEFIQRLYQSVKAEKSWVKVGISPFGIWRDGYPKATKGKVFSAYDRIYADARKWLVNGWLDYLSPQLYWKIEQTGLSYPVLLNWWLEQNTVGRHIFPGIYTSRVNDTPQGWQPDEIAYQIRITRGYSEAGGNVHFSMKSLMQNRGRISELLTNQVYNLPALVPASSWLNNTLPGKPELTINKDVSANIQLSWKPTGKQKVWLWVLQTKIGSEWTTLVLPAGQTSYVLTNTQVESVAVSAITRYGTQGAIAVVEVKENTQNSQNNS